MRPDVRPRRTGRAAAAPAASAPRPVAYGIEDMAALAVTAEDHALIEKSRAMAAKATRRVARPENGVRRCYVPIRGRAWPVRTKHAAGPALERRARPRTHRRE